MPAASLSGAVADVGDDVKNYPHGRPQGMPGYVSSIQQLIQFTHSHQGQGPFYPARQLLDPGTGCAALARTADRFGSGRSGGPGRDRWNSRGGRQPASRISRGWNVLPRGIFKAMKIVAA